MPNLVNQVFHVFYTVHNFCVFFLLNKLTRRASLDVNYEKFKLISDLISTKESVSDIFDCQNRVEMKFEETASIVTGGVDICNADVIYSLLVNVGYTYSR
mgnify:FL=1